MAPRRTMVSICYVVPIARFRWIFTSRILVNRCSCWQLADAVPGGSCVVELDLGRQRNAVARASVRGVDSPGARRIAAVVRRVVRAARLGFVLLAGLSRLLRPVLRGFFPAFRSASGPPLLSWRLRSDARSDRAFCGESARRRVDDRRETAWASRSANRSNPPGSGRARGGRRRRERSAPARGLRAGDGGPIGDPPGCAFRARGSKSHRSGWRRGSSRRPAAQRAGRKARNPRRRR